MPLARVRTSLSTIPEELKQQLQLAGYDIEVVPPGKKTSKPADLELTLESLPIREALNSAGRADTVYIATGALATRSAVSAVPRVELQPPQPDQKQREAEQRMLAQRRAEQQAIEAERLRREQEKVREEKERQNIEQMRAEQRAADQRQAIETGAQKHGAEDDRNARLQAERDRVEAETLKQQHVLQMWREAEARYSSDPEVVRLQEEKRRQQEQEGELRRHAQLAEEQRLIEEHRQFQAEQARIQQEQGQVSLELQRRQEEIRSEQRRLRAERERFQRDRLMNEQAAQRAREAVVQVPANVVPITAASLDSVIVEPTVIRTASGETANLSVTPVAKGAQFVERRRRPRLALLERGARRLRHKEYRRAAVAAAGLTALVMTLWITLSSREPASPLATTKLVQSAGIEQAAPFGPAKLNAPAGVPQPVVQKTVAPKPVALPPAAIVPEKKRPVAAKASPRKKSRSVQHAPADDEQEVVVRHFGNRITATTTKKTASTKDGIKVFSDMD